MQRRGRITSGYTLVLLASFVIALVAGWTSLAARMDGDVHAGRLLAAQEEGRVEHVPLAQRAAMRARGL